jgi:membrane protein DedA with SNARE-associated domain
MSLASLTVSFLEHASYSLLFVMMLVEGHIVTMLAGAACAAGILKLPLAYATVTAGDLTADSLYYAFGRWGRESFIKRYGKYVGLTVERVERLDKHIGLHANKLLVIGKITHGLGGTFMVAAGMARMSYPRFMLVNAASSLPKSLVFLLIGYYYASMIGRASLIVKVVGIVFAVAAVIVISVYSARVAKTLEMEPD